MIYIGDIYQANPGPKEQASITPGPPHRSHNNTMNRQYKTDTQNMQRQPIRIAYNCSTRYSTEQIRDLLYSGNHTAQINQSKMLNVA